MEVRPSKDVRSSLLFAPIITSARARVTAVYRQIANSRRGKAPTAPSQIRKRGYHVPADALSITLTPGAFANVLNRLK